jgi:hypothetical protein
MRSFAWGLAAAVLVLAGVAARAVRVPVFHVRQGGYDTLVAKAVGDQAIRQTITSRYPGLTSLVFEIVEPYPPDDQPVTIQLQELSALPRERLILTQPLGAWRQQGQLRATFDPLDDSDGRHYLLVISSPGSQPLRLRASTQDMYVAGELAGGGDLMFEAHYNGLLGPTAQVLLRELTADKPGLLGQPWFYVALAAANVAVLGGTLATVARARRAEAQPEPLPAPDEAGESEAKGA